MQQTQKAARLIAQTCPNALFLGFSSTKMPCSKVGIGVGKSTPVEDLLSASELVDGPPMGAEYFGLYMQHPTMVDGQCLSILDLDNKSGDRPHPDLLRLIEVGARLGLLMEHSLSMQGVHIAFLAPPDATLPKAIPIADRQFIEIFGHPGSSGKSVLLTGFNIQGEVRRVESVRSLLEQAGIEVGYADEKSDKASSLTMTNSAVTSTGFDASAFAQKVNSLGRKLKTGDGRYNMLVAFVGTLSNKKIRFEQAEAVVREVIEEYFDPQDIKWERDILPLIQRMGEKDSQVSAREREAALSMFAAVPEVLESQRVKDELARRDEAPLVPVKFIRDDEAQIEKPPEMIVRGFLRSGLNVLAGAHGSGKTTALLSLIVHITGLVAMQNMLPTRIRRKVLIATEDVSQVTATLRTMRRKLGTEDRKHEWMDWITVVPAMRLNTDNISRFVSKYRADLTYTNEWGHVIEPVIVLDTASSMLALENENDNSEVSKFVGAIKGAMGCGNVLIVGHLTKALKRAELDAAFRGASAWEADAHGTAVLFRDEKAGCTVMATIKRRFQAKYTELHFGFHTETQIVENDLEGEAEELTVGYCTMEPGDISKRQDKAEAKEDSETRKIMNAAVNILQASKFLPDDKQFISPSNLVREARKVVTGKDTEGRALTSLVAALRDDDRFLTVKVTAEERAAYKLDHNMRIRAMLRSDVHGVTDVPLTPSADNGQTVKASSEELLRRFMQGD